MSNSGDYTAVRRDIASQLKKPDYDDGSAGPVFVRLAWFVFSLPIAKYNLTAKALVRDIRRR